ncbi:ABC transporter permease [Peribacillus sp. NPDC097225]|uniref:ABC transporter permease n=1 Tax=Peribacillus sp. NPDC097225 TaxID=3364400 RepID=UPI0037FB091E
MRNMFVFTSFYLKVLLKNRKSAAALWLTPIFFLLGAGVIGNHFLKEESRVQAFQVAVINEDPTVETKMVIQQLTDSPHLNGVMTTLDTSQQKAYELLHNNKVAAVIYIPKGFSRDVARGINTPVKVTGNSQRPLQSQLVRHVMESAADFTSAAQGGINTIDSFMEEVEFSEGMQKKQFKRDVLSFSLHVLSRGEIFDEKKQKNLFQESLLHYYAISFYILLIMIWSFLGLLLLKRNESAAIENRLLGLGFSHFQSTLSRMLAAYIMVSVSSILIALLYLLWNGISKPTEISIWIGSTLVAAFVFITFFSWMEAMIRNERFYQFAGIGLILLGAVIGEHFIPVVYFPDWLQILNLFSLNGWVLKFMFAMVQEEAAYAPVEIGSWLIILSLCSVFIIKGILQIRRSR